MGDRIVAREDRSERGSWTITNSELWTLHDQINEGFKRAVEKGAPPMEFNGNGELWFSGNRKLESLVISIFICFS
jgi:hypothetical protein